MIINKGKVEFVDPEFHNVHQNEMDYLLDRAHDYFVDKGWLAFSNMLNKHAVKEAADIYEQEQKIIHSGQIYQDKLLEMTDFLNKKNHFECTKKYFSDALYQRGA